MLPLLLVAAALTLATGDLADAAVILLVITVNTTAGYIQEVKAEHAVAALSAGSDSTAPTPDELSCRGPFGPPRRA
ncbi:hypothetical protein ACWC2K_33660 [Streptomyces chattanoogensis]